MNDYVDLRDKGYYARERADRMQGCMSPVYSFGSWLVMFLFFMAIALVGGLLMAKALSVRQGCVPLDEYIATAHTLGDAMKNCAYMLQ